MRVERGLFNVLYRMLWDRAACQDVMHDAFLRLWSRRESLHGAQIDALAYATAINLARNRLRWTRLRRWAGIEDIDAEVSATYSGQLDADLLDLRAALAGMQPGDREVLLLTEYSGYSTAEVAGILGIAPGTVGSRRHRALARLRAQLKGEADGE